MQLLSADRPSQGPLRGVTAGQALPVPVWRHHALLTDRIEPLLDVERGHRRHAVVE